MNTTKRSLSTSLPPSRLWLPLPGPLGVGLASLCLSFPHPCNGMVTLSHQWAYRRRVGSHPTQKIPRHTNPVVRQCPSARTPSNSRGPHIPSLSRQSEQPTQRLTAKTRMSLRAMALAGSALRGWGQEHPQGGRGLGSHPGESPAPFGGPLLPLPCLTHRPVPGALEEEPPVPSPATTSFGCGRPRRWGQREEATKGRSSDPVAFPSRAFLPASARRGSPPGRAVMTGRQQRGGMGGR